MRLTWSLLISLAHCYSNFYRGKVGSSSGRYEDASGILRELPIDFLWTQEQIAFIKYKHNIVIPKEHGLVTNRQNHYSFTKHTQFPVNLWPTSRTKHVTIIPILISNEFASVYISELENTINSLTSQAGCVEFLPISPAEVRSFTNWIRIEPGEKCSTMIGLPDNERDELRITLATGCKDSPAVVRSILLHAAGVIPSRIAGRDISNEEISPYKLCSRTGIYSLCDKDPSCLLSNPRGYVVARSVGTRDEAAVMCQREFGMDLAVIQTPEESRIVQYLLKSDDQDLERAKYWIGNKPNHGLIGGKWRGVWATGFPIKSVANAPVYMSYSASGWEWRNDLSTSSKLPAICEGKKAIDDKPYSFCLNNLCSTNAQCNPTAGAYTCKCKNGYFGSGFSCIPTNCPPGTVQLGEACVRDQCTHCKPRFACINENAGTPSATCKCKEGWSGNGKLCLPKKNVARSDIEAFAEPPTARPGTQAPAFFTEQYAQMLHDNLNLKKSQSSGMAALNSLTSKLNQLQNSKLSPEPKKSLWRTNEPQFPRTSFADKFASIFATASTAAPTYAPTYAPSTIPPTPEQFNFQPTLSYRNSFGRTVPPKTTTTKPTPQTIIITQPPIDVDSLKIEMSDFAAEAARAHAKAVGENISAEQEKLQKEVDRVLELVQAYMAQSEDERKSLENELDRMKEYTQLFSVRLEEISSDVDQVESLKKSAIKEEHQYNQLSKIAQNLRNEIYNLEDSFKTTVEDTKEKVNTVESEVVNNRMKVEKAQYANKNNAFRINQAENKIKQIPEINEKTEKTIERVDETEKHLGDLDGWVNNLDSALEQQHYDIQDTGAEVGHQKIQITLLESNLTSLDEKFTKSDKNAKAFKHQLIARTNLIGAKEKDLEAKVSDIEQASTDFTNMINNVSSDVANHHIAFETGLRTASTSAAYAKQTASQTKNTLEAFMKRSNRSSQTLFGKINRQNDLLAFLMNKVQKLEKTLEDQSK